MSDKLQSIQALRGIAALTAFVFHLVVTLDRYSAANLRQWVERGQIGVDLFFVISGFVMLYSVRFLDGLKDSRTFLVRRYWRLAPVLYIVTLAAVAFQFAVGDPRSLARIVNCFTILPVATTIEQFNYAVTPAWTLGFEACFYLLVAGALLLPARWRISALLVTLSALPFLPIAWSPAFSPFGNPMVIEFAFGVGIFAAWQRGLITPVVAAACAAAGVALLVFPLSGSRGFSWGVPMALLFASALRWRIGEGRASKMLLMLGTMSYSLYLSHIVTFNALVLLVAPFMPLWAAGTVLAVCGLGIAWLVYKAVEEPALSADLYRRTVPRITTKVAAA